MTVAPATRRVWLVRLFKLAVVGLLVWGVHRTLRSGLDELRTHSLHLRYSWLAAAAGFYVLGLLPPAWFFHRVLRALEATRGENRLGFFHSFRAHVIGHLGKYVPGKAMVLVLRAGLLPPEVDRGRAAVAVIVETLATMSAGAFLAATILIWIAPRSPLVLISIALMAVSLAPILPPVLRRLASLGPSNLRTAEASEALRRIHFGLLAEGWLMIAIGWILWGLSLWATTRGIGGDSLDLTDLPLAIAAASLAVVAGFLSLIPGGAVVRELILTELLAPQLGSGIALATAVMLRLVWLVAEVAVSGMLYAWRK